MRERDDMAGRTGDERIGEGRGWQEMEIREGIVIPVKIPSNMPWHILHRV